MNDVEIAFCMWDGVEPQEAGPQKPSGPSMQGCRSPDVAIREGLEAGQTYAAIGDKLGLKHNTVWRAAKRLGVKPSKRDLGPMPGRMIDRVPHYEDMLFNGTPRETAMSECGFTSLGHMSRIKKVAASESDVLKTAVHEGLLTMNGGANLAGQSEQEILAAIADATRKQAAKAIKDITPRGETDRFRTLMGLLADTLEDWRSFQQNILRKGGWIPSSGEKAEELQRKLEATFQVVSEVTNVIRAKREIDHGDS